jgi:hypothetical protein
MSKTDDEYIKRMAAYIDQEIKDNDESMKHLQENLNALQSRQRLLRTQRNIIINSKWGKMGE